MVFDTLRLMGRPKGSTVHSDTKIILALLLKPRRFSEFEWALVEDYKQGLLDDAGKPKNPVYWKRFVKTWRLSKKTLARRLDALVARGWVIKRRLPIHGRHVEYLLNFSKSDEILEELHIPKLKFTRSEKRLLKKIYRVVPLRDAFPELENMSSEEFLDLFCRLDGGKYVCPSCLAKGEGKKAMDVSLIDGT
ncbi:MAG TPA: hypothetical protein ENN36_07720, partial [Candidatus Bathyarchaeota archaeon]|nr:hypothetical protein [Candidatus Bathyarchaeota archaeon]